MKRFLALVLAMLMMLLPLVSCEDEKEADDDDYESSSSDSQDSSSSEESSSGKNEQVALKTYTVVVADMSVSNAPCKEIMSAYIKSLKDSAKRKEKVAVIAFAGKSLCVCGFDDEWLDSCLDVDITAINADTTSIEGALESAQRLLNDYVNINKRIVLLSDGRQENKDEIVTAVKALSADGIRLDALHLDLTRDVENTEVQLVSVRPEQINKEGANTSISALVKATRSTMAKVSVYKSGDSEDILVCQESRLLMAGDNTLSYELMLEDGFNSLYVTVETQGDVISQNNKLYSWISIQKKAHILLVDGDGAQASDKIKALLGDYSYTTTSPDKIPTSMEALLAYDEIVFMNVDLSEVSERAQELVKRYVVETGRGVVYTCGSNSYKNKEYSDSPFAEILPIEIEIDETKEESAVVLVVDLSSSMGQAVYGKVNKYGEKMTRYDMALEGLLDYIDSAEPNENEYVGVIVFDADSTVALPLTQLSEKAFMKEYLEQAFEEYFYEHTLEKGEVASFSNRVRSESGTRDANGFRIKAYGTMYGNGISKANVMLDEHEADLKQMIFISDGEPQDKGSGYDSTIRRMASSGVLTSTIGIGDLSETAQEELVMLATMGKGVFDLLEEPEDFVNAIKDDIKLVGEPKSIYAHETELVKQADSKIFKGVADKLDKIGGYYGTKIKDGATLVVSAENNPLIAEWDYGKGHVVAYMSDLGGEWSSSLFTAGEGDPDNIALIKGFLTGALNERVDSSGLVITSDMTDGVTIVVETPVSVRMRERLVAYVRDPNGNVIEYTDFVRASGYEHHRVISTPEDEGVYEVYIVLLDEQNQLYDRAGVYLVNNYSSEYDLYNTDARALLEELCAMCGGELLN